MPRLKGRRGAVVVLLGIMIIALTAIAAIAMDFSRLWALRNELQTSADAGALAGAIQLLPPNVAGTAPAVASNYATQNKAMYGTVSVDAVVLGDWDDHTKTFTPEASHTDAVKVVVSRQSTGLVMAMLGVPLPRLQAQAIAWADAPVAEAAGCLKPWAIPFTQLMYRINQHRGIPNTPDTLGLYRPFDQVHDLAALNNMSTAERTFNLKLGSTGGQVYDTVGAISGSYQAVRLPKLWDYATQSYPSPGPSSGASAYEEHLSGGTCNTLAVGDSLQTESGNKVGPTLCGVLPPGAHSCGAGNSQGPGVCSVVRGHRDDPMSIGQNDARYGDCVDSQNNVGVDIKAAFFMCRTGCNGQTAVVVSLLGSFTLTKVFPDDAKKNQNPYTNFSKSEIVGIFKPLQDNGDVGPGQTTLVRPILVK